MVDEYLYIYGTMADFGKGLTAAPSPPLSSAILETFHKKNMKKIIIFLSTGLVYIAMFVFRIAGSVLPFQKYLDPFLSMGKLDSSAVSFVGKSTCGIAGSWDHACTLSHEPYCNCLISHI